ncbi:MAG TPA: hypothetical protein VF489_02460 [Sphingobium sp.]
MSKIRMAASAAYCFVALFSGQAIAAGGAQCWQPYEVEAAKVRDLHVMLMLGTLKCQSANPDIASKYDAFIQKKNDQLNSYNNILKARFMRTNGIADGQHFYEEFNTKLGNWRSGSAQPGNVCEITDTLLTLATNADRDELPLLAQSFSESRLGTDDDCSQAATPAVGTVASADATVSEAAAPVEVVKADHEAVATPSAAAALEAAAVALQTAAASLKAQAAPAPDTTDKAAMPVAQPVSATTSVPAG